MNSILFRLRNWTVCWIFEEMKSQYLQSWISITEGMSPVWTERFHPCRNVNSSYKPGSSWWLGYTDKVCKAETNEELRNVDKIKYSNMVGQVSSHLVLIEQSNNWSDSFLKQLLNEPNHLITIDVAWPIRVTTGKHFIKFFFSIYELGINISHYFLNKSSAHFFV